MLLFLPIDIDLTNFKFTQLDESIEIKAFNPFWHSSLITEDAKVKNGFGHILNQLPLTEITVLTYKKQKNIVNPHIDVFQPMSFKENELEHIRLNEPAGYRIVIKGATDSIEIFNGVDWVTAHIPTVPCCYLLNSTMAKHRIKEDIDRTTIYMRGFLDEKKHQELIKKSFEKYGSYAVNLMSVS
jgi:hypothetical protein